MDKVLFMKKLFVTVLFLTFPLFSQTNYTILISFDGFRYDYMDRGLTPTLKEIEKNGVRAASLRPVYPSKTFPNHYSIITGLYPENHGIIANTFYDPYTDETYNISDSTKVTDAKWYTGEAFWETAQRSGIIAASYFWPGSEISLDYRRPRYCMKYDHHRPYKARVDGVIDWLKLPHSERPRFITLYFDAADTYGHTYGPDSDSLNHAIGILDGITSYLLSRLPETGIQDSVNLIFVSDHGMTQVDTGKYVDVEQIIGGEYKVKFWNWGTFVLIQPEKDQTEAVYKKLKQNEKHFKAYRKGEIPDFYHFSASPLLSDIILVSDLGWEIGTTAHRQRFLKWNAHGNHGYEKDQLDMHGFFLASGPDFRKGYKTGTLRNIDIYPLLCEIFGIPVRSNIDGRAERIRFVLAKNAF